MIATDDAWRKRVAARVEELDTVPDTSEIINIVITYADEARMKAMRECARICRDIGFEGNMAVAATGMKCANAIEQLAKEKS